MIKTGISKYNGFVIEKTRGKKSFIFNLHIICSMVICIIHSGESHCFLYKLRRQPTLPRRGDLDECGTFLSFWELMSVLQEIITELLYIILWLKWDWTPGNHNCILIKISLGGKRKVEVSTTMKWLLNEKQMKSCLL